MFEYFDFAAHPLLEGLIVPLYDAGGVPLGTLWVVHHDVTRRFDAEDARVAEHLALLLVLALKLRDGGAGAAVAPRQVAASVPGGAGGSRDAQPDTQPCPARTVADRAEDDPFILKLHGFAALSPAERAALRRLCTDVRIVGPRTDLVREDDAASDVLLVLRGFACRYKLRNDGSRQVVAYLVPGDLCDPDGPLLERADHSVGTMSACTVASIPRGALASVMQEFPAIARAVRIAALVDEATLREWLLNVGRRTAEERLAHLFCEVLLRMRAVGLADGDSCELPVTQTDLADTTGLSVVHVNRVLQEMRRQGLIVLSGGRLSILDLRRLRALAEFKPNYLHLAEQRA